MPAPPHICFINSPITPHIRRSSFYQPSNKPLGQINHIFNFSIISYCYSTKITAVLHNKSSTDNHDTIMYNYFKLNKQLFSNIVKRTEQIYSSPSERHLLPEDKPFGCISMVS